MLAAAAATALALAAAFVNHLAKSHGRVSSWVEAVCAIPTVVRVIYEFHWTKSAVPLCTLQSMMEYGKAKKPIDTLVSYTPRDSDVVVAVPGKSGTTVLQMICHQLRVGGKTPDWEDTQAVMPWLELTDCINSYGLGDFGSLDDEQVGQPRVYKSHLPYVCTVSYTHLTLPTKA